MNKTSNTFTSISPKQFLAWASISLIILLMAGYDTLNAHIWSEMLNLWILQNLYVPPLTETMPALQQFYRESLLGITALGSDIVFVLIIAVIFLDLIVRREFKALGYGLLLVILILGGTVLCKHFIYSPRPMFPLEYDSFPSGHVVRTSIWCGMIILFSQLRVFHLSKYWQWVLVLIPFCVAFTRIALGYHWLSDVIASLALSVSMFLLLYYFTSAK